MQQQTSTEKIKEAHAIACAIPNALTLARRIELRNRLLDLLAKALT